MRDHARFLSFPMLLAIAMPAVAQVRAFEAKGPLDWRYPVPQHRDVADGVTCYVLESKTVRLVVSGSVAGNNGCGTFRPGWIADFGLLDGERIEGLDWTELVLREAPNLRWDHRGRWLDLGDIRVEASPVPAIVAAGTWQGDATVRAEVRYTLHASEPLARVAVTLENRGKRARSLHLGCLLDYDHADQAFVPGHGWNAPTLLGHAAANWIYGGPEDGRKLGYGLAWWGATPSAINGQGYLCGAWFPVRLAPREPRSVGFYLMAVRGGEPGYRPVADLAARLPELDADAATLRFVSGTVRDERAAPAAGATVFAVTASGTLAAETRSCPDGGWYLLAPAGSYVLRASRPGFDVVARDLELGRARAPSTVTLDLAALRRPWIGVGKRLNGSSADGSLTDLVLENGRIALVLGADGRARDLASLDGDDLLESLDVPLVLPVTAGEDRPALLDSDVGRVRWQAVESLGASTTQAVAVARGRAPAFPDVEITQRWILEAGRPWLRVETVLHNHGEHEQKLVLVDRLRGKGGATITTSGAQLRGEAAPRRVVGERPWIGRVPAGAAQALALAWPARPPGLQLTGDGTHALGLTPHTLPAGGELTVTRCLLVADLAAHRTADLGLDTVMSRLEQEATGVEASLSAAGGGLVRRGGEIRLRLQVRNRSSRPVGPLTARLRCSKGLEPMGESLSPVPLLPPGQSRSVDLAVVARDVGPAVASVDLASPDLCLAAAPIALFATGAGWYYGDAHMHTRHSDGAGSVADNVAAARRGGLSFVFITDHNTVKHAPEVSAACRPDFLCLVGEEVSTSYGHANAYLIDEVVDWKVPAAQVIGATRAIDGLLFVNHPFFPGLEWKHPDVDGYHGMEVWNGFYPPRHEVNAKAFALWDRLLNEGRHVVGLAGSDAHNPWRIGDPRFCAYLEDLTPSAIKNAMVVGRVFGTNGPELGFTIDGTSIGGTLRVPAGREVAIRAEVSAVAGPIRVVLVRNGAIHRDEQVAGERGERAWREPVVTSTWYRLEVEDAAGGFAFSNPIWVEVGDGR